MTRTAARSVIFGSILLSMLLAAGSAASAEAPDRPAAQPAAVLEGSEDPLGTQAVGSTRRLSMRHDGTQTVDPSSYGEVSADARFLAFLSTDPLITSPGVPPEAETQAYLRDRRTGTSVLASHAPDGSPADDEVVYLDISADGSTVVFSSRATNLVPGHGGGAWFAYDRASGAVSWLMDTTDVYNDMVDISADGRLFVAHTDEHDIVLLDRVDGTSTVINTTPDGGESDGPSYGPSISADGTRIVFTSKVNDLVEGMVPSKHEKGFLHDTTTGLTELITSDYRGDKTNGHTYWVIVSADGRWVALNSYATDLVRRPPMKAGKGRAFVYDTLEQRTTLLSIRPDGTATTGSVAAISGDGALVVFNSSGKVVEGPPVGIWLPYIWDSATESIRLAFTPIDGVFDLNVGASDISDDGRLVALGSVSARLVPDDTNGVSDVFLTRLS